MRQDSRGVALFRFISFYARISHFARFVRSPFCFISVLVLVLAFRFFICLLVVNMCHVYKVHIVMCGLSRYASGFAYCAMIA